jgi:cytochrome oxidase assembly protein ShyY1
MKMLLFRTNRKFEKVRLLSSRVKSSDIIGSLLFGSICLGAGTLGVWQVQRYYWKVDLMERERNLLLEFPLELPRYPSQRLFSDETKILKGKCVELFGEYLHENEILLGPRPGHKGVIGAGAQGMGTNPQVNCF